MPSTPGWKQLVAGWPWFRGEGSYPLPAYSEFLPPPRLGRKPYGVDEGVFLDSEDPWGWPVTEYEQAFELRPGLEKVARQILGALAHLGGGRPAHGISRAKLHDNPYWPPELAAQAGRLPHERYITLLPLALSRTQDDKGRTRWTLFGCSEQGPARGFWKSFHLTPRREVTEATALDFLRRLLHAAYEEPAENLADLRRAGFRILPDDGEPLLHLWAEGPLPRWASAYLWTPGQSLRGVKYLLTFRPFGSLPAAVRKAYLAGELHLLPFPGSLVFWGCPQYLRLCQDLPLAVQIPLLHLVGRHEDWRELRVPQSGWLHESRPGHPEDDNAAGTVRNTFQRTNRWAKVERHEDELALTNDVRPLVRVLFSARADDLGLYGKPMARNVQLWTRDGRLLLDGPRATRAELEKAMETVEAGGLFGYRFLYPALRVGVHELYWHRPLVAYLSPHTDQPTVLPDAPAGYLTAYRADAPDLARPVELWPRLLDRPAHTEAVHLFQHAHQRHPYQTTLNVRKLLDSCHLFGRPLPQSLARALLTVAKPVTLAHWLDLLPEQAADPERGRALADELRACIEPEAPAVPVKAAAPQALTFAHTARRAYEVNYWKTIASLAEGKYLNKNNADCVRDPATQRVLCHRNRDLEALGRHLLTYYDRLVKRAGLVGKALVGDLPFHWRTDFHYSWSQGWLYNQEGREEERNLVVVIPGRDRKRAIIMADHYDTAYMLDRYDKHYGGNGARLSAAGADDNHSATAALMLGAPLFLELSKAGRLDCDIWLVHLTGEEFPADCLGARHLTQSLVEGSLAVRLLEGGRQDVSGVRVEGVYVLDMVAHNNDHDRDVFQISPGAGRRSLWLAYQAQQATELWNAGAAVWNRRPARRGLGRSRRSPHGAVVPEPARHPHLYGEVRPPYDPRSTLFNTDGQIFSDAGVPVVLFMENYDINRTGYHDTHDTMENIDLDYGAAVSAIAIESVARAASEAFPG